MAVLPSAGPLDLSAGLTLEQQPSLTWGIDTASGRIHGTVTDLSAVKQAVDIILNTERFRWQIFSPSSGMQREGLLGQNPGYVAAELRRRILDALLMDDRVRGISDFHYTAQDDAMTVFLTVSTVYGQVQTEVEVQTT